VDVSTTDFKATRLSSYFVTDHFIHIEAQMDCLGEKIVFASMAKSKVLSPCGLKVNSASPFLQTV